MTTVTLRERLERRWIERAESRVQSSPSGHVAVLIEEVAAWLDDVDAAAQWHGSILRASDLRREALRGTEQRTQADQQ